MLISNVFCSCVISFFAWFLFCADHSPQNIFCTLFVKADAAAEREPERTHVAAERHPDREPERTDVAAERQPECHGGGGAARGRRSGQRDHLREPERLPLLRPVFMRRVHE